MTIFFPEAVSIVYNDKTTPIKRSGANVPQPFGDVNTRNIPFFKKPETGAETAPFLKGGTSQRSTDVGKRGSENNQNNC